MNRTIQEYNAVLFLYQQIVIHSDDLCVDDLQLLADLCLAYKSQKDIKFPPFPQWEKQEIE